MGLLALLVLAIVARYVLTYWPICVSNTYQICVSAKNIAYRATIGLALHHCLPKASDTRHCSGVVEVNHVTGSVGKEYGQGVPPPLTLSCAQVGECHIHPSTHLVTLGCHIYVFHLLS